MAYRAPTLTPKGSGKQAGGTSTTRSQNQATVPKVRPPRTTQTTNAALTKLENYSKTPAGRQRLELQLENAAQKAKFAGAQMWQTRAPKPLPHEMIAGKLTGK